MSTLNVSPLMHKTSPVANYKPNPWVFITDAHGDMLWSLVDLKLHYPRLYRRIMGHVTKGQLQYNKLGIKMYYVTMIEGVTHESN